MTNQRQIELGGQTLQVSTVSLLSQNVLVLALEVTISKGTKFLGRTLKRQYRIPVGTILTSRWIEKQGEARRIYAHFASIYAVLRSYKHAMIAQPRAKKTIRVSLAVAKAIIKDLLESWPLTAAQRVKLLEKLAQIEVALERARKLGLREARDKVELSAQRVKDGTRNQGARVAQISAVRRRLTLRLEEITAIVPFSGHFYQMVRIRMGEIWAVLELIWHLAHNAQRAVLRAQVEADLYRLMDLVGQLRAVLPTQVWPAPFAKVLVYVRDRLVAIDTALRDTKRTPQARAREVAGLFASVIARLQAARRQRELERVIWTLSIGLDAGTLDLAKQRMVQRQIWELRQGLDNLLNGVSGSRGWVAGLQGLYAQAARHLAEKKLLEAKETLVRASSRF